MLQVLENRRKSNGLTLTGSGENNHGFQKLNVPWRDLRSTIEGPLVEGSRQSTHETLLDKSGNVVIEVENHIFHFSTI